MASRPVRRRPPKVRGTGRRAARPAGRRRRRPGDRSPRRAVRHARRRPRRAGPGCAGARGGPRAAPRRPAARGRGSAGRRRAGVDGGDQHPHPHQAPDRVGDLQDLDAAVPEVGAPRRPASSSVAHRRRRRRRQSTSSSTAPSSSELLPRPVLERRGGEVRRRQDHPPVVPQAHDHVGQGDLLDPAPLRPRRSPRRRCRIASLNASCMPGEQVGQRGLGGQAGHDADHAGGREQARARPRGRRGSSAARHPARPPRRRRTVSRRRISTWVRTRRAARLSATSVR